VKSILLTNDDGIEAEGLKVLRDALRRIAHVFVVAPDRDRSAVSHGLTIRTHFRFDEVGLDMFTLNGTPAECVIYALDKVFVQPPDLVISGINHGANLGDHIMYSGTVAAAREAARHGIPAMAISQDYQEGKKIRFKTGVDFVRNMVSAMLNNGLDGELLLNVNIPIGKINGMKITRHGCSKHMKHFNVPDEDWAAMDPNAHSFRKGDFVSDRLAILENYVSVTPLERDQTDYVAAHLLGWVSKQLFNIQQ
jgi:5'-nucleotidase